MLARKSHGTATLIELVCLVVPLPGLGSVYAGNMAGLVLTFTYLPFQLVNIFVLSWFCGLGFVLMPVVALAYLILGLVMANNSVTTHNQALAMQLGATPI
jgi:hypothetical protein